MFRSFSASRGDAQALAELGFVVVQIDGMCTPWRSKSFHASCYGSMEDNTLPDQVVEVLSPTVIQKEGVAGVPAQNHVVEGSGIVYAMLARHMLNPTKCLNVKIDTARFPYFH